MLPIRFVQQDMTTYSGLALVDHVLRLYRLQARLKETFKEYQFSGDYHIGDILFVLVVMLLLGAERLQHIDYLRSDPLFCRVVRLTRIPHRTKISTALKQFASDSLKALIELNGQMVIEKIQVLITTQFLQSVKVVSWPNGAAERHFVTKRFFGSSGF